MKTQRLIILLGIAVVGASFGFEYPGERKELYRISQHDENSTREEVGYLVDGSLLVIGMYEFNGDDNFIHSTSFTADKHGYRARVSQRPIGTPPIDNGGPEPGLGGFNPAFVPDNSITGEPGNIESGLEPVVSGYAGIDVTDSPAVSVTDSPAVSVTESPFVYLPPETSVDITPQATISESSENNSSTAVDSSLGQEATNEQQQPPAIPIRKFKKNCRGWKC